MAPAELPAPPLAVVHEDDRLLVVNKPADLVCHPTKGDGRSSLVDRARAHLPPGSRVHLVNRLDRETSGLVVFAKQPETARDLGRHWERRTVRKGYWAIVHGWPEAGSGRIVASLGRDPFSRVAIKDTVRPDGVPAATRYRVAAAFERVEGRFALLAVEPESGRKHQIRIHLAYGGHPLVGDKLYGPDEDCYLALVEGRLTEAQRRGLLLPCHALHAAELVLPSGDPPRRFRAEPEPWFREFLPAAARAHLAVSPLDA